MLICKLYIHPHTPTQGTLGAPLHLLAMLTYFYGNELLVQTISIPLGVPVGVPMVQRGVGVYVSRRVYSDYIVLIGFVNIYFFIYYIVDIPVLN